MSWVTKAAINVAIGVVTASVMAVMAIVFFQLGPWVERTWFPVVSDFRIVQTMMIDGKLSFRFTNMKWRDCRLTDISLTDACRSPISPPLVTATA